MTQGQRSSFLINTKIEVGGKKCQNFLTDHKKKKKIRRRESIKKDMEAERERKTIVLESIGTKAASFAYAGEGRK